MLVLTRRPDEALVIGDNIVVRINAVSGNQVRVGIAAPRDVKVRRLELLDAKEQAALLQNLTHEKEGGCAPSSE